MLIKHAKSGRRRRRRRRRRVNHLYNACAGDP
jgi:hypothetical protein